MACAIFVGATWRHFNRSNMKMKSFYIGTQPVVAEIAAITLGIARATITCDKAFKPGIVNENIFTEEAEDFVDLWLFMFGAEIVTIT